MRYPKTQSILRSVLDKVNARLHKKPETPVESKPKVQSQLEDWDVSEAVGMFELLCPSLSFTKTVGFINYLSDEEVTEIALKCGFKLKEQPDGTMALNPYVFDFVRGILFAYTVKQSPSEPMNLTRARACDIPDQIGEFGMFSNPKTVTGISKSGLIVTPVDCSLVLIKRGDMFLGVSRKDNHSDIGLPGGKRERDESFEQCAVREALEETGFNIKLLNTQPFVGTDKGLYCRTFLAEIIGKSAQKIDESETGLVAFFDKQHFIDGSFGEYNTEMFKHFGW